MSWDTTACFKAVCTAFCDFQRQPSEKNAHDLQRQIDVVLGVTSHGAILNDFTPKQLVYAETLSALVSIVNDPNMKTPLYIKSLMALSQLANDLETKLSLQNDFNLGSSVVGFILRYVGNSTNKQMVLQALLLLEKMTYGSTCVINNIYMVDLLKHLIKSIYTTSSEFCIPSLAVLANLCRYNVDVKTFVKTMSDVKQFGKTLLSYLSNSNKTYSITSLSILTNLYLNDSLGENMFSGQNLINMIRLVFNVLIGNDDVTTRHYSIDLIIDFVKCEKTLNIISGSSKLESDVFKILNLLHTTDPRTAVKIFELLIEFCKHSSLCQKVIHVFIKNSNEAETQLSDDVLLSPAQSLLHWLSRSEQEDAVIQANVLSLVFLKDLLKEILSGGGIGNISPYITQVISILLPYLGLDLGIDDMKKIKQKFRKLACVFELLSILCGDDGIKGGLVEQIDFDVIFNVVVNVFDKFSEDLNALRDPALACKQEIISVVFRALELMCALKHNFDSGLVKYSSLIQNTKLLPLLSHGLASNSKFLVHASLQIIAEGTKVNGFQSKTLGETLTRHNSCRQEHSISHKHETSEVLKQEASQGSRPSQPLRDVTNTNKDLNSVQESTAVAILTERLTKGLDLKDTKVSDIMGFYEHKLSAVMGRENHIQDLLEAKSKTLTQTERLLAEYRCRHAQSEAECLKLCSMLQKSERKCENDMSKISELEKGKRRLEEDIKKYDGRIKVLESVAAEYEQLKNTSLEQLNKVEALGKSLAAAQDENASLESMKNLLIKNGETLQVKLDNVNEQLRLMGEEKKDLTSALKEKDKATKRLEKTLKDTKDKVASLEVFSQELEQTISEKENTISQLHTELEKQSQIAAMIHNLTMGKMSVPGTSSGNTSK